MNQTSKLVIAYKAASILERDALLNELQNQNISAITGPNDTSRKITNTTVDLAFEWHSATFKGFPIFVAQEDKAKALSIIQDFLTETEKTSSEVSGSISKFYRSSVFSLFVPGLFHITGVISLIRALKAKEPINTKTFILSVCLYALSLLTVFVVITSVFRIWPL